MWFRKILLFFFLLKISIYWALPCYKKLDWLLTHKLLHYTFGVIFFFLVFCYYDFIGYKSNNYESNKITWYFVISHILGNNFPSILYLVNILMTVISDYWLLDIFFCINILLVEYEMRLYAMLTNVSLKIWRKAHDFRLLNQRSITFKIWITLLFYLLVIMWSPTS